MLNTWVVLTVMKLQESLGYSWISRKPIAKIGTWCPILHEYCLPRGVFRWVGRSSGLWHVAVFPSPCSLLGTSCIMDKIFYGLQLGLAKIRHMWVCVIVPCKHSSDSGIRLAFFHNML